MMLYQCMEYIDCLFLYLKRLRFVIDIDSNLRMNKTTVKARNLKQMAQMINYLREHGLLDLTELQKKTADVTVKYHELSEKIKSAEPCMGMSSFTFSEPDVISGIIFAKVFE